MWFEDNEIYDTAAEYALISKDYERGIQIIGKIVESMWEHGKHAAILSYGNALPYEIIETNPEFCLYYSWILIETGEIEKAGRFLLSAEKQISVLFPGYRSY